MRKLQPITAEELAAHRANKLSAECMTKALTDAASVIKGKDGSHGTDGGHGKDGHDGRHGVGIDKMAIIDGNLHVFLTNGSALNAGRVKGLDGIDGSHAKEITHHTTETIIKQEPLPGLPGRVGPMARIQIDQQQRGLFIRHEVAPGKWSKWHSILEIEWLRQFFPSGGGGGGSGGAVAVEDSGTPIIAAASTLNFGSGLDVVNDGGGKVTISAPDMSSIDNGTITGQTTVWNNTSQKWEASDLLTQNISGSVVDVAGDVVITGDTEITSTTASTSTTTGALTVAGGVGIGGSQHIGDALFVSGAATHNSSIFNIRGGGNGGNTPFTAAYVEFGSGKTGNGGQYKAIRLNWLGTGGDPEVTGFEWVEALIGHEFQSTYGVRIELTGVNDEASSVETYRGGSFRMRVDGQSTQAHTIYGVYADGSDAGTNPNSTSYGIYATASSAAGTAWAGYFDGALKTTAQVIRNVSVESATATDAVTSQFVVIDTSGITRTTPASPENGQQLSYRNISSRNTAGDVTIAANAGQTVDGLTSFTLSDGESIHLIYDSTVSDWVVF